MKWSYNLVSKYLSYFHRKSDITLTPSQDQKREMKKIGIDNVAILGHGVNTRLFSPLKKSYEIREGWGAKPDSKVFLYVGRVSMEKNLDFLFECYLKVAADSNSLVITGDGPYLKELIKKYPFAHFSGRCEREKLAQIYASADVFIFPSETETFGNVILEAMASGLVVVAYRYDAAKTNIINGVNGFTVPVGDEQKFSEAMGLCVTHDLGRNARKQALSQRWGSVYRKFERTGEAVLLARRAKEHERTQQITLFS